MKRGRSSFFLNAAFPRPERSASLRRDEPAGRRRIYDSIAETVGNTPLLRVRRFSAESGMLAQLLVKHEGFNPSGSIKDRSALAIIEALEREGRLRPGNTMVEASSGAMGMALAWVCAARG